MTVKMAGCFHSSENRVSANGKYHSLVLKELAFSVLAKKRQPKSNKNFFFKTIFGGGDIILFYFFIILFFIFLTKQITNYCELKIAWI